MSFAVGGAIALGVLVIALSGIRVAQEYERAVVFRLGRYVSVRGPGLYYLIPLIEWKTKVDTHTVTVDIPPQETITKDSVTIKVNAVLWFRITDVDRAIIAVADYQQAVYQAALTSLRNIIVPPARECNCQSAKPETHSLLPHLHHAASRSQSGASADVPFQFANLGGVA